MEQMCPCRADWPLFRAWPGFAPTALRLHTQHRCQGLVLGLVLTWELLWWHPHKLGLGKCSASDLGSGNAPAASLVRGFNPLSSSVVCN